MAGSSSRLPENQLREREKDGRLKKFIWDVLTLRMVAYVCAQPASFSFIVSFLLMTVSLPPMAAYIKNAGKLPDLDTMRSWNAYLGRLPSLGLCIENASSDVSPARHQTVSAFIDFQVDCDAISQEMDVLVGHFSGTDLHTRIKSSISGERLDHLVNVTVFLSVEWNISSNNCIPRSQGCVDISAPDEATPSQHPQIPGTNFTFRNRVLHSVNHPERPGTSCAMYYHKIMEEREEVLTASLTLGDQCKQVVPEKEKYRKHGLINIYLSEDQKVESYQRILLGTLGVAVIGVAFAFGIGCTERPPKPKNRPD